MYVTEYFLAVERLFAKIRETQADHIYRAGLVVATSMSIKGAVHVMDTGHLLRHEAFYRAGGLRSFVPFDFTFTVENEVVHRKKEITAAEQEALVAREINLALDKSNIASGDVLILNSNSGRTTNVVEAAIQANERGVATIAISSRQQLEQCEAVHPGGYKLFDVCDICIDNCGPYGDAMVPVEDNEAMGPASGIAAAYILWAIQAEAIQLLEDRGLKPTILKSVHTGGEQYLEKQHQKFLEQGF